MKNAPCVVAIGAHPDDIEFGAIGTLKLLKDKGCDLHFVTMTAGSMGTPKVLSEDVEAIRYHEARSSAQKLSATYDCVGENDFEISAALSSVKELVRILRKYRADIVITHPKDDYMLDHEMTHRAVRAAANQTTVPRYFRFELQRGMMPEPLDTVPYLYYFAPTGGVDLYGNVFPAHFLVALGEEEMRVKRECLAMHKSQREWLKRHYGIDEYIAMMEKWSSLWIPHFNLKEQTRYTYAEAFCQDLSSGFPRKDILKEILGDRFLATQNYKLSTDKRSHPQNIFLE